MNKLNLEIQKKMMPVPLNLTDIESCISILENLKPSILPDSYETI